MANKGYTTEVKVEDYMGEAFTDSTVPSTTAITSMIGYAEKEVDERTGTTFTAQTNTDELNSSDGTRILRLQHRPIIAVTNCYVDKAGLGSDSSPDWEERLEGRTSTKDFVIHEEEGYLYFYRDKPSYGIENTKCTYTSGYAAIPANVEHLTTLLVVRMVVKARIADNAYNSQSHIQVGPIRIGQAGSQTTMSIDTITEEINNLWKNIGTLKSHMI